MYGVSDRYGVINGGPPRTRRGAGLESEPRACACGHPCRRGNPPRVVKRTNIRAHGHGNRPLDIHTDRLVCFAA